MSGNLGYLFAAYTVTWVVVFLYIFSLQRRQGHLRRELVALRDLLQRK